MNGCIFCASVHARKASQYQKTMRQYKAAECCTGRRVGTHGHHHAGPRLTVVATLFHYPFAAASLRRCRRYAIRGLDTLELLDVIQSAAFFAWANRLMLTLGEPFLPEQSQG
ncbi:hypothetical protein LZ023_38065 (plasmid) [Pseudomonas silvicola]|nr:hypothetical protein LZ023_38065 [Pseudomonas silvicola]